MTKKGIIFDVDGTLWDSAAQVALAWSTAVEEKHPEAVRPISREDILNNMGKTMTEFGEAIFGDLTKEKRDAVMEDCMSFENFYLETHPGRLYPGVKEGLSALARKYSLYVVSNCQDGYIEVLLKSCGFCDLVEDFECFGRTGLPKWESIRMVIGRCGVDRCFYVGDTAMDEQASEKAGIPFVHAAYGFGTALHPAAVIASFAELEAVAEKLLDGDGQ